MTSAISSWRKAVRYVRATSPTQPSASSMPGKPTPSSSPPGIPAQTRSSSRYISVRAVRSIPTSISSSSSIRLAVGFPPRRTNTPAPAGMGNFPDVRIGDDVRAQHKFVTEKFDLKSLALVVGGSMGAQQTYEWAIRYPDMVKRAAPVAGTARNTIHDSLFTETLVEAITSDPGFNRGFYASSADVRDGLLRHAKMWAVMGWSTEFFQQGRHKALGFSSMSDFIINFMNGYFSVMDPNDLLCMAWKWQRGDVSRHTGGDLRAALGRIKAKTFVMPMASDMFFPPSDCQAEWRLIPNAEFRPIQTIDGHLALFGADPAAIGQLDKHLSELLAAEV